MTRMLGKIRMLKMRNLLRLPMELGCGIAPMSLSIGYMMPYVPQINLADDRLKNRQESDDSDMPPRNRSADQ
jgi:hypothetical protein